MSLADKYYLNGSIEAEFKGKSLRKVNEILFNMFHENKIKSGFFFKTKYKNSSDLRPDVLHYDESFIDLLIESNIDELLFECIGSDYLLSHIQIRKLEAGNTYLDWHRDSYNYGKKTGDFPPAHKIIFHPFFRGISDKAKLKLSRSSHLKIYNNKLSDFFNNIFPFSNKYKDQYFPSENRFMLFNGSVFHKVCSDNKPSICLIYSFLRKKQIRNNDKRFTSLSQETSILFEKKILEKQKNKKNKI